MLAQQADAVLVEPGVELGELGLLLRERSHHPHRRDPLAEQRRRPPPSGRGRPAASAETRRANVRWLMAYSGITAKVATASRHSVASSTAEIPIASTRSDASCSEPTSRKISSEPTSEVIRASTRPDCWRSWYDIGSRWILRCIASVTSRTTSRLTRDIRAATSQPRIVRPAWQAIIAASRGRSHAEPGQPAANPHPRRPRRPGRAPTPGASARGAGAAIARASRSAPGRSPAGAAGRTARPGVGGGRGSSFQRDVRAVGIHGSWGTNPSRATRFSSKGRQSPLVPGLHGPGASIREGPARPRPGSVPSTAAMPMGRGELGTSGRHASTGSGSPNCRRQSRR